MDLSVIHIAFMAFAALTIGAAIGVVISQKVVYALFLLFATLLGMAGLFVFAGAEFIAVSQIIIYVGGILIILLFGVMLTHKLREMHPRTQTINLIPGVLASGVLFALITWVIQNRYEPLASGIGPHFPDNWSNAQIIGAQTITEYLLPFELVSFLLLIALIGAAFISRKSKEVQE